MTIRNIAVILWGFILFFVIVSYQPANVFAAEEKQNGSLEIHLNLNVKNGDLTTTLVNLSPRMVTVSCSLNPFVFKASGVYRNWSDDGMQATTQMFSASRSRRESSEFAKYLPEEFEQMFPPSTLRLSKGKSWKHTIKVWEIAIWDDLVESQIVHPPDMRFSLVLTSGVIVNDEVVRGKGRIELDRTTIDQLQSIRGKFPMKKQPQVKWLFYPRVEYFVKINKLLKIMAEKLLAELDHSKVEFEKDIAECNKTLAESTRRLVLYEKFRQWDAKTLREQNTTVMRPWRGQNGMPLDFFAKVVRLEGDTITFEDDEGRSFEYDIMELADNDQEYVRGRHSKESQEAVQIALE